MNKIIVLGAGMVGSAMAIDLSAKHKVTIVDINGVAVEKAVSKCNDLDGIVLDVTDKEKLQNAIAPFDLVVCAVPGFLGFQTLKNIIEAGKNVVDISFFAENALELDELAKQMNVTAIVDCGVAPGMGNIILGYHDRSLEIEEFLCLVGGLPKKREWPFEYKAPFSPIDVLEEYTRPARYVENGSLVVKEALSDSEFVDFENIGTLEAFNTDGLRSLIYTMPHIPNMKEKTLRYPGHIEYIKVLKKAGFFKNEMINIGGASLSPMEFTSKILLDSWKLGEYEEELTVMEITIKGKDKLTKKPVEIKYNLYDEYDVKTNTSSMARTTGYTATAVVNLVLDGLFSEKGIFPPELLGNNEICYNFVMKYLNDRGVVYEKVEK